MPNTPALTQVERQVLETCYAVTYDVTVRLQLAYQHLEDKAPPKGAPTHTSDGYLESNAVLFSKVANLLVSAGNKMWEALERLPTDDSTSVGASKNPTFN